MCSLQLLCCYLGSRSAELKAESVWHRGYIGASYQGGSMQEECFCSTWSCTKSDDKLIFSPSPHLPASKHTNTHNSIETIVLHYSNTINTSPPGHLTVLYVFFCVCVCVPMCVFALELGQERILLERQSLQYSRCKERKKEKHSDGDRHEKLECKDWAGRLYQHKYKAMSLNSKIKALGWNLPPHPHHLILLVH